MGLTHPHLFSTDGLHAGIMRSTAEWAAGKKGAESCPIIGIAPWAGLMEQDRMALSVRGKTVRLPARGKVNAVTAQGLVQFELDNNHTHYVLVDNGRVGDIGGEYTVRGGVEGELLRCTSVGQFGTPSAVAGLNIAIQVHFGLRLLSR
jgi:hypothetical protein